MDDDKKIIEKRSSFRGWKERNKGKSREKIPIIGVVAIVVIISALFFYQYSGKDDEDQVIINPPIEGNNSSFIEVVTPINTQDVVPTIAQIVTPVITENIKGKMNTPLVLNGFEITATKVSSSPLFTNVWVKAKNIDDVEKPLKIGPSTVVIDDMGEQYENIHIQRSSEIIQTNLMAKAMREGSIFFSPLKEGRTAKKLILNIDGQKAEIMLEK